MVLPLPSLRFSIAVLVAITSPFGAAKLARATESQIDRSETVTIETAIDAAKHCVVDRNINVVGSFIESARLERGTHGGAGSRWVVTWAYSREIKGGRVTIAVSQSLACDVTYGE
jgi:hypothetical protein